MEQVPTKIFMESIYLIQKCQGIKSSEIDWFL